MPRTRPDRRPPTGTRLPRRLTATHQQLPTGFRPATTATQPATQPTAQPTTQPTTQRNALPIGICGMTATQPATQGTTQGTTQGAAHIYNNNKKKNSTGPPGYTRQRNAHAHARECARTTRRRRGFATLRRCAAYTRQHSSGRFHRPGRHPKNVLKCARKCA